MTTDRRVISMSEAARRYGIGRDRIRAAIRSGSLPWKKVGRAVKVSTKYADALWGAA